MPIVDNGLVSQVIAMLMKVLTLDRMLDGPTCTWNGASRAVGTSVHNVYRGFSYLKVPADPAFLLSYLRARCRRELCQEMALASPRMSRNDTAIEVHAGATMGRASFALLRAYPNLGSVLLQEEQRTRLAVALERVEAAHTRHVAPELLGNDDRYGDGGGGVVRPLNKHLAAVVLQADAMGGFTLAISALGLVPRDSSHSRMSLERPDDAQQKMLRNVRTALRQIYAMLVRWRAQTLG